MGLVWNDPSPIHQAVHATSQHYHVVIQLQIGYEENGAHSVLLQL